MGSWIPICDQENQNPDELLSKLRRTTNKSFFQCPTTSLFHAWVNPNFTKLVEIFKGWSSRGIGFALAKIQSLQWHPWLKGCVCLTFWNGDYIHIMKIGYNFVVKLVQSSVVQINRKNLDMHLNSGHICIHTYLDFRFSLIFGPIHNYQILDIIVSLCITLLRLAHLDRINILGGHILTIQICIRFRDLVCYLRFTSCRV